MAWYLSGQKRFKSRVVDPGEDPNQLEIRYELGEGERVIVSYDVRPFDPRYVEHPTGSGTYLPQSFGCLMVLHDVPYVVGMHVATVEGSAPNLMSLTVSRRGTIMVGHEDDIEVFEAPSRIRSQALHHVPIGRLFRLAKLAATHHAPDPAGVPYLLPREEEIVEMYRSATREAMGPRMSPKKNRPLDDEHYHRVARVYMDAIEAGDFPTKAVVDEWNVSTAAASRYVKEARHRKFLPPLTEGKTAEEAASPQTKPEKPKARRTK